MKARNNLKESKTMNNIPCVEIKYINDDLGSSDKRCQEASEIIFQMMLLSKKRGRPSKKFDIEVLDAA